MFYYKNNQYTEEELEITLLYEYLSKDLDEDIVVELLKTTDKNKLAKSLGRKDIGFFGLYFLPTFFIRNDEKPKIRDLSQVHYDIFEELNKVFVHDLYDKDEFIVPRGTGKSTVINKLLSCWCHCYKTSSYTVIIGKKEDDATSFIYDTKMMLKSKKIKDNFGELVVDDRSRVINKQELELDNDTKIYAVGSGTSIRGTTYGSESGIVRPELIIVDDFINKNDITTPEAKEKILGVYYNEILQAGDKGTKFLVIGTPLAQGDFIASIKEDAEFHCFHRSVCDFDVDEYFSNNKYWQQYKKIYTNIKNENRQLEAEQFYQNNIDKMYFERLWNGKWSCTDIANNYFTKRLSFMQELMCDCEHVGEVWITNMAKLSEFEMNKKEYEKSMIAIDPASTDNTKSDSTAITVLSKTENGFYCIREGLLKKWNAETDFDKYIDFTIELLLKYKEVTHVLIEKNVYKGIDKAELEKKIMQNEDLCGRDITVELKYNTKNKDERIATITEKINSGTIIFNESNKEYNDEVMNFRGQKYSKHDDAPDSLEMAVNYIDTIEDDWCYWQ